MNFLRRVSFTAAASHETFGHMLRGFATAAGKLESEQVVVEKMTYYNRLMNDMSKAEELSRADRLRQLKRSTPNKTTYTSLIDAFCKQDRFYVAYRVLNQMIATGFSPSSVTFNDVLRGFILIGDMKNAHEMHNKMNEHGSICGGSGWMDKDTWSLFLQGLTDEVTYTSLMNAYFDEGKWDDASELYGEMSMLEDFFEDNGITHIRALPDSVLRGVFINGLDNTAWTTQINKELLFDNYISYSVSKWPLLEFHLTLAKNCSDDEFKSLVELVDHFCSSSSGNAYDTMLKSNYYKPDGIDDGILYNLFVIQHCQYRNIDEAYNMYKEMVHNGFACHMFTVFALVITLERENMVNELLWVIQNVLRSCNLNDSEIVNHLNEFNPKRPISDALLDVLAEKAKDGLFLKCSYAPPSA